MMRRDPLADPAPLIRRVYSYVAYRIGAGPEAEDVTSDVFERAVRYRDSYDPRRGEPLSWLLGIARRRIADRRVTAPLHDGEEEGVVESTPSLRRPRSRARSLARAARRRTIVERFVAPCGRPVAKPFAVGASAGRARPSDARVRRRRLERGR